MRKNWIWTSAIVVLALLALAAGLMWRAGMRPFDTRPKLVPGLPSQAAPAPLPAPVAAPASVAQAASEPAINYPIEAASAPNGQVSAVSIDKLLGEVFGSQAVLTHFQTQDFARRFVATVDNLGREQATTRLWPVNPTAGRFTVDGPADAKTVSADNGQRYTTQLLLLESVDMKLLVAAYVRAYPQLQRAYEELGFPRRYFNDRFVQVIDLLLATPEPQWPLKVHLPTLQPGVRADRPWVLYEFDDPALRALTSGQKLLVRMGPVNERRVKTKLAELRRLLVSKAPAR